ncbi:Plug domain-containing protein [Paraglaciecola sp. Hal342]
MQGCRHAESQLDIEEITITGRKMEEGLQHAPIAISAFSELELENRGAVDITDVAAASPNVHFQTGGSTSGMSAAPTVFIRGIGQSDFSVNNDPAVGMYIDGIYLGRMLGSLTDLMDLDRLRCCADRKARCLVVIPLVGQLTLFLKSLTLQGV